MCACKSIAISSLFCHNKIVLSSVSVNIRPDCEERRLDKHRRMDRNHPFSISSARKLYHNIFEFGFQLFSVGVMQINGHKRIECKGFCEPIFSTTSFTEVVNTNDIQNGLPTMIIIVSSNFY